MLKPLEVWIVCRRDLALCFHGKHVEHQGHQGQEREGAVDEGLHDGNLPHQRQHKEVGDLVLFSDQGGLGDHL